MPEAKHCAKACLVSAGGEPTPALAPPFTNAPPLDFDDVPRPPRNAAQRGIENRRRIGDSALAPRRRIRGSGDEIAVILGPLLDRPIWSEAEFVEIRERERDDGVRAPKGLFTATATRTRGNHTLTGARPGPGPKRRHFFCRRCVKGSAPAL